MHVKSYDGEAIAIAPRKQNLYNIKFMKVHKTEIANLVQFPMEDDTLKLWHRRLGHLNMNIVHILQNMMSGMNLGNFFCSASLSLCETYIEGKQYRVCF